MHWSVETASFLFFPFNYRQFLSEENKLYFTKLMWSQTTLFYLIFICSMHYKVYSRTAPIISIKKYEMLDRVFMSVTILIQSGLK